MKKVATIKILTWVPFKSNLADADVGTKGVHAICVRLALRTTLCALVQVSCKATTYKKMFAQHNQLKEIEKKGRINPRRHQYLIQFTLW